jgi:hypothetical protein
MTTKQSERLLRTDVHKLADTTRFSKPANPTTMTLDQPSPEWLALFEKAGDSEEDWNCIMRVAQRCSPAVYFEAQKRCNNRHIAGKKLLASRERAQEFLDSM